MLSPADWPSHVQLNEWNHVRITFDTDGVTRCYINRALVGTSSTAPNYGRSGAWTLLLGNLDGDIDEVWLSNIVRPFLNPPASLTVQEAASTSVTIAWQNVATNAADFIVERREAGTETFAELARISAMATSYADNDVAGGMTYAYRVRSAFHGDKSAASNVVTAALPDSFSSWTGRFFSSAELQDPEVSGLTADPDHDGIENLMEYALGLDPRAHSPEAVVTGTIDLGGASHLTLQYVRMTDAIDLIYDPQVSPDLVAWSPAMELSTIDHGDGTETITVRDTASLEGSTRRFIRLRVIYIGQ